MLDFQNYVNAYRPSFLCEIYICRITYVLNKLQTYVQNKTLKSHKKLDIYIFTSYGFFRQVSVLKHYLHYLNYSTVKIAKKNIFILYFKVLVIFGMKYNIFIIYIKIKKHCNKLHQSHKYKNNYLHLRIRHYRTFYTNVLLEWRLFYLGVV